MERELSTLWTIASCLEAKGLALKSELYGLLRKGKLARARKHYSKS